MHENRRWIERNRKELTKQYPGKVIIVVDERIAKVLDPTTTDVLEINRLGRELANGADWDYTTLSTARGLL